MTSPLKAVRERCKDCSETLAEIRDCEFIHCAIYPYRMGKSPYWGKEKPSSYTPPLKAIRAYCLDCCLDQPKEVRLCPDGECAVHPFRFGDNPFASEAKREAGRKAIQRLKSSRSAEDFRANSSQGWASIGSGNKPEKTAEGHHGW